MDENKMEWREYARYAEMSVEELARDCEVQVFRATGPGGQRQAYCSEACARKAHRRQQREYMRKKRGASVDN